MADDEIILADLDDDDLVAQMFDDLYDGLKEEIEDGVNILLERGWTPYDILTKALVGGMKIVGDDFRDGILFVPEVLLGRQRDEGRHGDPEAASGRNRRAPRGQDGDRHRQGRHPRHRQEPRLDDDGRRGVRGGRPWHQQCGREIPGRAGTRTPDILGMSALLTTTMPYMKVVIDTLKEKGIRDDYIVLVGGAPLNEEFGRAIGADAYCRDAAVAVEPPRPGSRASTPGRRGAISHGLGPLSRAMVNLPATIGRAGSRHESPLLRRQT